MGRAEALVSLGPRSGTFVSRRSASSFTSGPLQEKEEGTVIEQ